MKGIKEDTLEFSSVMNQIQIFLEPVFEAMVNEVEWLKKPGLSSFEFGQRSSKFDASA